MKLAIRLCMSLMLLCSLKLYAQNQYTVQPPPPELQFEIQSALHTMNELRASKGLSPLQLSDNLSAYAQRRAEELLKKMSHTRPNGKPYHHDIQFMASAENIAAGYSTGQATIIQWKNSKGHYQNMMGKFDICGLGVVYAPNSKYRYYWVLVLGDESSTTPYQFASP